MTAPRVAMALAATMSVAFGLWAWTARTGAIGGSDSSCYALMTRAYASGRAQPFSELALEAPWPDATRVAAPGGFLPSSSRAGAAIPICAPGYGLFVAPLAALAGLGIVHVVPAVAGGVLVMVAFMLGRRLESAWAGLGAAALVASHPVTWFQAVQPMNDITTAALWSGATLTALGGRALATGALVGLGLLVRPNLALAAVAIVLICARPSAAMLRGRLPAVAKTVMLASMAALPAVVSVLLLNASLYGSPFATGYGDVGDLFAAAHVPANVVTYGGAFLATSTPVVWVGLAAPFVLTGEARRAAWTTVVAVASLGVVYLPYRPLPEWWYLRFFLPGIVLWLALASATLMALSRRVARGRGVAAALIVTGAVCVWTTRTSFADEARGLQRLESRLVTTAAAVASRMPASSVAITSWQSGPIRFGPGHEIVMWDALDPTWLDRAITWLDTRGRQPLIVLERWEEGPFRARFTGQAFGGLDWPPRVDVERRVRVWVAADRARFLAGEPVSTDVVGAERRR